MASIQSILACFYRKDDVLTVEDIHQRMKALPVIPKVAQASLKKELIVARQHGVFRHVNDQYALKELNPKGVLQETLQKQGKMLPVYYTRTADEGYFESTLLYIGRPELGEITCLGRTKQMAEENAARIVLFLRAEEEEEEEEILLENPVHAQIREWASEAHPALAKKMIEWVEKHV